VRPIWEWAPIPALSVTTEQASTGAFNGMWIEVEGRLYEKSLSQGSPLTLKLSDGQQNFLAITSSIGAERLLQKLPLNSMLRLRGICTVDPALTHDTVPFVLILRSIGDAKMVAGPPWWTADHIAGIVAGLLAAGFILYVIYARAKDWKLRVVMAERENLSHEIHDMLSQCFAGIGFQLRGVLHRLQNQPSQVDLDSLRQEVSVAYGFVKRSHDVSRASLGSFHPEALESAGLIPALEQCAKRLVTAGGVEVDATATGDARPLPVHVMDSLFRIGQEALSNAVQHARPTRLRIGAHYSARRVRLTIEDNGIGFDTHERSNGLGLNGMKLRAEDLNGTLEILSEPGRGTQITVSASIPSRRTWLQRLAYIGRQE
jgi:signal transduction histidine kinase